MHVLILHMRYRPDATGTGPLVTELAEDLSAAGEDVTVVTSVPHYGRGKIPSEYRARLVRKSVESGVKVYRTLSPVPHVANAFGRAVDYVTYTALAGFSALGLRHVDVILCVAPPITVGLAGWLAGLRHRCPIVFNAQDIWPDGLIALGRIRSHFVIRGLKIIERVTYNVSARITVVSDGMKANLQSKGVPTGTISVIPNWVDTDVIRPEPKNASLAEEAGVGDRCVVLFAGNLGLAAGLETVIDAAGLLRSEKGICFLIVGEGVAKQGLQQRVHELGLANVLFLSTQPAERLSQVFASADISLVTLRQNMGSLSVPSKSYAIMASARPILAAVPVDSEVRRLVEEANCGVCIPPEDPGALAAAIRAMAEDSEMSAMYGRNGRRYAEQHYSRADLTSRYRQLLLEVSGL